MTLSLTLHLWHLLLWYVPGILIHEAVILKITRKKLPYWACKQAFTKRGIKPSRTRIAWSRTKVWFWNGHLEASFKEIVVYRFMAITMWPITLWEEIR